MAQHVYAIIKDDGDPVMATMSREHAFEECRKRAGVKPVSFSPWENGDVCRVTHGGDLYFRIYCLELKS